MIENYWPGSQSSYGIKTIDFHWNYILSFVQSFQQDSFLSVTKLSSIILFCNRILRKCTSKVEFHQLFSILNLPWTNYQWKLNWGSFLFVLKLRSSRIIPYKFCEKRRRTNLLKNWQESNFFFPISISTLSQLTISVAQNLFDYNLILDVGIGITR